MFHKVSYQGEVLHALLDFAKTNTVHAFKCAYSQFARLDAVIATMTNKSAVFSYVLYAQQVAKGFTVEDDIYHCAVRQAVPKYSVTQGLFIILL